MQINQKIPESLNRQLNGYENALMRAESLLTLCAALSAMILSFLIAFGSDRLWNTLPLVRFFIILLGLLPLIYIIFKWGQHWVWKRRTVRDLASGIQKHHKQLGDRLLGAIELAEGKHDDENISEELLQAAIKRIAEQSADIDFKKDIDKKKPSTALLTALLLFSLVGILFYLIPDAFNNALLRWSNPLSSISRFTFTVLGELPEEKIVPVSEPFEMICEVEPSSYWWKPSTISYNLEGSSKGSQDLKNGRAELKFGGIAQPSKLDVSVGDTSDSTNIKPVHRPSLKELAVEIEFPEYIKRECLLKAIEGGTFSLLEGSSFKLKGNVSRNLIKAYMAYGNQPKSEISVKSVNFATEKINAIEEKKIVLNWEDVHKLTPAAPYELNLKVEKDSEPFVECPQLAPFSAILIDESLNVDIRAEDDYGIKMIDAEFFIESVDGKKVKKNIETISLSSGGTDKTKLGTSFLFSPDLMNLPEKSLIALKGVSKDYFPGRKLSKSNIHRIYILSHDQHAQLVQDRLERIMAEVEDLIRREKESLNKSDKISKLDDKEMAKKQTTDKITDQKLREQREKRETEKMIAEAMKLLKEALRNKKFPDKTISEWSKFMEQMKNLSQQDMKDVVSNLQKAQDQQQQQQRRQDMEKTAKAQREMIKKMQDMLDKMDDSLKNLSVENFVNRLKKQAEKENKISANLKSMMKDIVGLSPDKMPAELKAKFKGQIESQKSVNTNATEIRNELMAFFARTRVEKYQKVFEDMENEKMDATLLKLMEELSENKSGASMNNAKKMANNFNKWADMLGKGDNKKQDGGGQGGGKEGEVDMELLLAMLRMIQGEQNIRDKTRSLERNKPKDENKYSEKSNRIADEQDDLHRMLKQVLEKVEDQQAIKLLEGAGSAMKDAEGMLKKPQTDVETIAAQTEVIERLSGAFQQEAKKQQKGKGKGQGSKMMAMLMQMMMQGQGKGGSKPGKGSGGFSDDPNKRFTGPDFKKNDPERTVDKTGGTETKKLPEEYKNAIEAFYRKVKE